MHIQDISLSLSLFLCRSDPLILLAGLGAS